MECSACGAFCKKRSAICPECGARQAETIPEPSPEARPDQTTINIPVSTQQARQPSLPTRVPPNPSLIEFPGVNRHSLPEWRKELSDRVREAQERRAREAALEAAEISEDLPEKKVGPLLELLPQAEIPPVNPIVVAALRRIERANVPSHFSGNRAVAVAYEEQPEPGQNTMVEETNVSPALQSEGSSTYDHAPIERTHNLAVVPSSPTIDGGVVDDSFIESSEIESQRLDEPAIEKPAPYVRPKPKRLIRDDHDPALNYLDSVPTTIIMDSSAYRSAPVFSRMVASIVDLLVIGLLVALPLALAGFTSLEWNNPRLIGSAAGAVLLIGFLYLTINTAMTGRTLGMRLFSLRVVDARTGLIPTGKQSAGRAIVFLLSLASAGVMLLYTFLNPEKHTPHDRFTRTTVVRA